MPVNAVEAATEVVAAHPVLLMAIRTRGVSKEMPVIASKAAVEVTAGQRFAGWEDPAGPLFSGDFAEQEIAMSDWPPSTNCSACTQSHMRTSRIILCC